MDGYCVDRNKSINEITNLLHRIKDPKHLSNVHDWVIRLTTGEPSDCKTDYLRLLEYTLKSEDGTVREPFSRPPPPDGQLDRFGLARKPPSADEWCDTRAMGSLAAGGCCYGNMTSDDWTMPMDHEQNPTIPAPSELVDLVKRMDCETASLQRFVIDASRYTCDKGRLMVHVVDNLLDGYRQIAESVFHERTRKLGDALAKEQVALLLRYRTNGQRMLSRAQIMLNHLRELAPTFRYDHYMAEPDDQIRLEIEAMRSDRSASGEGQTTNRVETAEVDREDNDDAAQQKKLLCALNWLRSELERADCENTILIDRYDTVVAAIGVASKKKIANECRSKTEKHAVKSKLDELRAQSAKQMCLIDCLMEKIAIYGTSNIPTC